MPGDAMTRTGVIWTADMRQKSEERALATGSHPRGYSFKASLDVVGDVLPGQPLVINWTLQGSVAPAKSPAQLVTARIYSIALDPSLPLYTSPQLELPAAATGLLAPTVGETSVLVIPPSDDPTGTARMYQVGSSNLLAVEISFLGNPAPLLAFGTYTVLQPVPQALCVPWWTWQPPAIDGTSLSYHTPYSLSGTLTNLGTNPLLLWAAQLLEQEVDDSGSAVARGISKTYATPDGFQSPLNMNLAPMAVSPYFSWTVNEQWPWFDPVFFSFDNSSLHKNFSYTVEWQWAGNTAPPQTSCVIVIRYEVSQAKQDEINKAFYLLSLAGGEVLAAFFFALSGDPFAAAAAGAAAAASYSAAQLYAVRANDPPYPDFSYRNPVLPQIPLLPDALTEAELPALSPLRSYLELVNRILAATLSLDEIANRMVAAEMDGDDEGLKVQSASKRGAIELLRTSVAALPSVINEVGERFSITISDADLEGSLSRWRASSSAPAEVRQLWASFRLPTEVLELLDRYLRDGRAKPVPVRTNLIAYYKLSQKYATSVTG